MTDTKIPTSTPFSVYCQARAIVAAGLNAGPVINEVRTDPRLLFAAMVGVEDALLSRHEIEKSGRQRAFPTEIDFLAAADAAFPRHELVSEALGVDGSMSVMLTWDSEVPAENAELETDEGRIVDVIIGGRFRPTRATWQKLIDAGLPMCSWQEASESWDLEAAK